MAQEHDAFDIEHEPVLIRLVEEVRQSGEPKLLKLGDTTVAVIQPVPVAGDERRAHAQREVTEADWDAFRSAAGSWRGNVDGEQLKRDIYASRDASISTKAPGS